MSHLEPEAKIFACSQSVYLAEKIAKEYGIPLGKSPCQNTVTVSFNLLTKNLLEVYAFLLFALLSNS
jgi:hypothetical protein